MAKNDEKKIAAINGRMRSKKRKMTDVSAVSIENTRKCGIDEFDILFSEKKKQDKETKVEEAKLKAAKSVIKMARYKTDHARSSSGKKNHRVDTSETEWVDDGLGGKHNNEGYTGRVEDGVKIFKRHILNQPGAGTTKDCPFDCTCCFI